MLTNNLEKYAEDYVVEEETDPKNGKVRKVAVYRGPLFSFAADAKTVKQMKLLFPLLTLAASACFVGASFTTSPEGQSIFIMLPMVITCLPLIYLWGGCFRLLTAKEPLTREQSDMLAKRLNVMSALVAGFAGFSFVAHVVLRCTGGIGRFDLLMLAEALVSCGCGLAMFLLRGKVATVQTGSAALPDEEY